MFQCIASFKKFSIQKPGTVRLTWWATELPDDAPRLADGDVVTRTPPSPLRFLVDGPGVSGPCLLIRERFSCKDGIRSYEPTVEIRELDGDEDSTRELLTRALRLDLAGPLTLRPAQGELDLAAGAVH